jgi:hypothetical protein
VNEQNETPQAPKTHSTLKTTVIICLSVVSLALAALSVYLYVAASEEEPAVDTSPVVVTENTTNDAAGPYIDDNYLFVPHWDAKFMLSDALTQYGYSVTPDSESSRLDPYVVGLTAVFTEDLVENAQSRYYSDIAACSVVTVTKTDEDVANLSGAKQIIESDSSSYVVYDYTAHGGCPEGENLYAASYYDKVADALTDVLSKPEAL